MGKSDSLWTARNNQVLLPVFSQNHLILTTDSDTVGATQEICHQNQRDRWSAYLENVGKHRVRASVKASLRRAGVGYRGKIEAKTHVIAA